MKLEGNIDGIDFDIDPSSPTENLRVISQGQGNVLKIGKNCRISGHVFLAHGATLIIGDRVKSTGPLAFHQHEGSSVSIGDGCLFSNNVIFRPSDAHKIIDVISGERINKPRPITIEDGVWIGEQVLILKGARIGKGSIVGARSLLTKELVTSNALIAGVPARIIRTGVRWEP